MRTITVFFFVIFCLLQINSAFAKNTNKQALPNIKIFESIIEQWKDNYNSGNPEKVAALYSDSAYYLTQHYINGIIKGKENIKAYVKLGTDAQYKIDSIKIVDCMIYKDIAYLITKYNSTNNSQKAFGVNLVVVAKIGGKWLIVAHEAAVPDLENAIKKLE